MEGVKAKDFFRNLSVLFTPQSVAVIGASNNPNKLGYHVMKSLIQGMFPGEIVPVNPSSEKIMGHAALSSLTECQGKIDVAVIVLPAEIVLETIVQCHQVGVRGIVLITAGFKEIDDPAGAKHQERLAEFVNSVSLPVIGPNTFGMVNLHRQLNASFTPEFSFVKKGGVSLVSQSGGISHLLGFIAMNTFYRLGKIIGLGNRLNVDFAQMIVYLMEDPETRVVALYIEGLDCPRELMDEAKKAWGTKPIIALKTGRADSGNQSSLSHTGSMAGNEVIYRGAFRQSGIYQVTTTEELLDLSQVLSVAPLLRGPRVAVLSGQAGPSMAVCDVCHDHGLQIVSFTEKTRETIHDLLPPLALRENPVDMGPAWYNSSAIQGIVRAVLEDAHVDAMILLMMFASANRATIPDLSPVVFEWQQKKPIISCFVAPAGIWDDDIEAMVSQGALINMPTPERAGKAMAHLWHYSQMIGRR
jgi:acyl-CoA synthetase (NDP forming)